MARVDQRIKFLIDTRKILSLETQKFAFTNIFLLSPMKISNICYKEAFISLETVKADVTSLNSP